MTNNNIYLPKESIPKTEEVRYLDQNYQPMNYEDFMKNYEPNKEVEIILVKLIYESSTIFTTTNFIKFFD